MRDIHCLFTIYSPRIRKNIAEESLKSFAKNEENSHRDEKTEARNHLLVDFNEMNIYWEFSLDNEYLCGMMFPVTKQGFGVLHQEPCLRWLTA